MNTDLAYTLALTVSLLGRGHLVRKTGSHIVDLDTSVDVMEFLLDPTRCWRDVSSTTPGATPGCTYLRGLVPPTIYDAREACSIYGHLSEKDRARVTCESGGHGLEYQLTMPAGAGEPTSWVHVIIGEHEGRRIVYTWFPGSIYPEVKATVDGPIPFNAVVKYVPEEAP